MNRIVSLLRDLEDIEIGVDNSFHCPADVQVTPHPNNCELYYTCSPGSPTTLWQCAPGYAFDPIYNECTSSYVADCKNLQARDESKYCFD